MGRRYLNEAVEIDAIVTQDNGVRAQHLGVAGENAAAGIKQFDAETFIGLGNAVSLTQTSTVLDVSQGAKAKVPLKPG
ncbi:hypothetical protein [Leisingera sp. MMG026]|uniref:hypothetical protein n=1 Tax=Leisingera sp. MMG026 TaxID=2909982 RepID=UPI001F1D3F3F|nr:hypothetical protein [Leisingera sp. MMG026]MCF6429394.1 hypothetical protein [Leisingera sp. MMG026]